jgi:hypothetical protein
VDSAIGVYEYPSRLVVREHEAPRLTEHDAKQANPLSWPPIAIPHHSLLRACPASAINCRAWLAYADLGSHPYSAAGSLERLAQTIATLIPMVHYLRDLSGAG